MLCPPTPSVARVARRPAPSSRDRCPHDAWSNSRAPTKARMALMHVCRSPLCLGCSTASRIPGCLWLHRVPGSRGRRTCGDERPGSLEWSVPHSVGSTKDQVARCIRTVAGAASLATGRGRWSTIGERYLGGPSTNPLPAIRGLCCVRAWLTLGSRATFSCAVSALP